MRLMSSRQCSEQKTLLGTTQSDMLVCLTCILIMGFYTWEIYISIYISISIYLYLYLSIYLYIYIEGGGERERRI